MEATQQLRWLYGAVVGLSLYSVFATSALITRATVRSGSAAAGANVERLPHDPSAFVSGHPRQGSVERKALTVVLWTDYQCPFCRRLESAIDSLPTATLARTEFLVRQLPLRQIHPHARRMAVLSTCAARHASFPQVHRTLFRLQSSLPEMSDADILNAAEVDTHADAILGCVQRRETENELSIDSSAAAALKLTGTPTLLVGRLLIRGTLTARALDSVLAIAAPPSLGRQ